jgi:type IV pilus assembly protein PilM
MNTFGLDLGATSMKIVWVDKRHDAITLKSCLATITPAKGMYSESSVDQQAIAEAIQKLVVEAKITSKSVNIALPDNQVFTKVIEMPNLSDKELSSAIYWEAEQNIPAPLETMTLDFKVLKRNTGDTTNPKMQVLLVGAPTVLIQRYTKIFELTGLSISSIETEILAVIRGLVSAHTQEVSLIVNMGALGTSVAIVQNGIVIFTYAIPIGGLAMDRAIASNFGFTPEQAEEYKKTYGLNDQSLGGKITQALEPILLNILTEVKKALAYYDEKYKNESPISQIILTGGTSLLPGIDLFFVKNTGIQTSIGNPWKSLAVAGVPDGLLEQGPRFSVAIGLAIREDE